MATTADPKPGDGGAPRLEAGKGGAPPTRSRARRHPPRVRRRTRPGRSATCGSPARASAAPAPSSSNPLREGLRLERVPDPRLCGPVRGDRRPRPPEGHPGPLPAVADEPPAPRVHAGRGRSPAVRRRLVPRRDRGRPSSTYSRVAGRADAPGRVPEPDRLPRRRLRRRRGVRPAGRPARRDRRGARHAGQPAVLPGHPVVGLHGGHRPARPGRPRPRAPRRRLAPDRHREAVRARPRIRPIRLNREVLKVFRESQVYRIDHYLGKETVRNLLVFRFGNSIFEPLWNRRYVDHVQITVAESIGVETRGAFYEETGAVRDVLQNHLMQLLTLVAMEPPATFEADALRDEKVKVLRAVAPIDPRRGQGRRRPGPVRARLGGGPARARLSRGAGGRPGVRDRDVRGRPVRDRRLALGRRPVLRPDRQAAAQAVERDRDPVPAGAASAVQGQLATIRSRTCSPSGSSPTRASCCASAPRSPDSGSTSGRSTWTSPTGRRSTSTRPTPTRP